MANWITKLYEQLLHSLDDVLDIADMDMAMQTMSVFEQIQLTKEELESTKICEYMKDLYVETTNQYLKYRLEIVLHQWRDILRNAPMKQPKSRRVVSSSVFEAVIMDDDRFFETTSVPELLHRLLKSFDKNYKVTDMATVLNTIDTFEKIDIPVSQLATTRLVTYIRRLRRKTTNKYLSNRLRKLLKKWRDSLARNEKNVKMAIK
ncbi:uncharacterized protein LOC129567520 [Sitodiplosis mosellana]|uniref:uncharacterized protein LOC129567520 n=1 Tax=Sitodiplosis mosellana TaxID=263140 RepID=UPI0024445EAF|nr:uncharacterized protein LOC129567520 [Sitodiplosis mosellana]